MHRPLCAYARRHATPTATRPPAPISRVKGPRGPEPPRRGRAAVRAQGRARRSSRLERVAPPDRLAVGGHRTVRAGRALSMRVRRRAAPRGRAAPETSCAASRGPVWLGLASDVSRPDCRVCALRTAVLPGSCRRAEPGRASRRRGVPGYLGIPDRARVSAVSGEVRSDRATVAERERQMTERLVCTHHNVIRYVPRGLVAETAELASQISRLPLLPAATHA